MLKFFRDVAHQLFETQGAPAETASPPELEDRRDSARFCFNGRNIEARAGGAVHQMRLKDLSCGGASGITELAVPIGGTIFVDLPGIGSRAAEVRWVRNTTVGLKFLRPLDLTAVVRCYSSPFDVMRRYKPGSSSTAPEFRADNDGEVVAVNEGIRPLSPPHENAECPVRAAESFGTDQLAGS